VCTNSTKDVQNNQKAAYTREEVEKYFPGFIAFADCSEQQIPRPKNKERRKMYYSGKKKRHTIKNQLMVNNPGLIIHKVNHKKGHRHDYDIYKKNHPETPKQVVKMCLTLDILELRKTFQDKYLPYQTKRRGDKICLKKKKSTTNTILERE
jgi:DDE superfamily endonuclease